MNENLIQVDGKFYKECEVVMLPTNEKAKRTFKGWLKQYNKTFKILK